MNRADILVAGIGNIFLGDDAFGVEVVRRLAARPIPEGVHVQDFGIRGFDLAFALDSANTIILVDAASRGDAPGTLYTIEPDLDNLDSTPDRLDAHAMDPVQVLRLAKQMNVVPGRILVVGCEPATLGPENEGVMGLSPPVEEAVGRAVELIESMIARRHAGETAPASGARV
ncbi:MAG: hydrogenase maturation protease [Bryobacteraceae bacterium]